MLNLLMSAPLLLVATILSVAMSLTSIVPFRVTRWPKSMQSMPSRFHRLPLPLYAEDGDEYEDDDDEDDYDDVAISEGEDWRSFRAKLVMGERPQPVQRNATATLDDDDLDGIGALFADETMADSSFNASQSTLHDQMTPLDPSQWAYDSGKVIEKGAVILGGVEQAYGFGLRQQYFHKAAILIVDHDEKTFTRAIILNRPTDITLNDDANDGVKWRVWYGGDVEGLQSKSPSIICTCLDFFSMSLVPFCVDIQVLTVFHPQVSIR